MIRGQVWQEDGKFVATIFDGWYVGHGRTAKEAQANVTRAYELEQAALGNYDLGAEESVPVQLTLWSVSDGI